MKNYSRRKFIKKSGLSAAASFGMTSLVSGSCDNNLIPPPQGRYMGDFAAPKLDVIRVAFIGVGYRGSGHLKYFGGIPGTEVVAVSDLYEDNVKRESTRINHF